MIKVMPSPFKYAKKRTIPEIAASLARLKAEERDLKRTRKQNKSHDGVRSALWITRAQIGHVKREQGVPKRAGKRRTVKKRR